MEGTEDLPYQSHISSTCNGPKHLWPYFLLSPQPTIHSSPHNAMLGQSCHHVISLIPKLPLISIMSLTLSHIIISIQHFFFTLISFFYLFIYYYQGLVGGEYKEAAAYLSFNLFIGFLITIFFFFFLLPYSSSREREREREAQRNGELPSHWCSNTRATTPKWESR